MRFYGALFGWRAPEGTAPATPAAAATPGGPYSRLQLDGMDVAAIYTLGREQKKMGIPPHWGAYVAADSADEAARKARSLGARVFGEAFDVLDAGRTAMIQDPTGAAFSVWEAKAHVGAGALGVPGALCWCELLTTNTRAAGPFYAGLFGWGSKSMEMADGGAYTIFEVGGKPVGGMMQMLPEWEGVPSNWMVYFAVADCDASAQSARGLGAEIVVPPTDIPGIGRFAVLQDPQQAVFAIIKRQV
jgi:predicted enzyme related to lactoylglutathione lyase